MLGEKGAALGVVAIGTTTTTTAADTITTNRCTMVGTVPQVVLLGMRVSMQPVLRPLLLVPWCPWGALCAPRPPLLWRAPCPPCRPARSGMVGSPCPRHRRPLVRGSSCQQKVCCCWPLEWHGNAGATAQGVVVLVLVVVEVAVAAAACTPGEELPPLPPQHLPPPTLVPVHPWLGTLM